MADAGTVFWDKTAARYDLTMRLLGGPLRPMCDRVVADVRGRDRVLEVAAGTGLVTRVVAPVVGSLLATDYSEGMVAELGERVREEKLPNVTVATLDVFALDDTAVYDAIIATNVLHLLPDVSTALARLRGALRPGGVLIAPTYCHDQNVVARSLSAVMGRVGFPGQRRLTLERLVGLVSAAGFVVRTRELDRGVLPIGYVSATRPLDT